MPGHEEELYGDWRDLTIADVLAWYRHRIITVLLILGLKEDYGPYGIRHYGDWERLHGHDGRSLPEDE
jgi:hypothetical protein